MSDAGERLLVRMVPKTTNYMSGFGGKPELTTLDIAAALSYMKLTDFETRYIRAALLQAEPWGPNSQLGYAAWDWAVSNSIHGDWAIQRGKEILRRLSFLAIASRIDRRHFVCGGCDGVGIVLHPETRRLTRCEACAGKYTDPDTGMEIGNGIKAKSDRFYGRALGVDHKTYRATWDNRLRSLVADLQSIEGRVVTHIWHVVFDS